MWKNRSGFTLIEMLVVIAVVGVLSVSTIAISIRTNLNRANDHRRAADLESIRSALEIYQSDSSGGGGSYPANGNLNALTTNFIGSVPTDPTAGQRYFYISLPGSCSPGGGTPCRSYFLCAAFQGAVNSPVSMSDAGCGSSCGTTCNYAIANP